MPQQIIRYNMPLVGGALCLILVASQTLSSVATNPSAPSINEKQNQAPLSPLSPIDISPSTTIQQQQQQQQQQNAKQQQLLDNVAALASSAFNSADQRQGRSVTNANNIDGNKYRAEAEKRQVQEFLTPKNLFKNIISLLWGTNDERSRNSKHVLEILSKALDVLKNALSPKARSSARGLKDTMEDVASAGVSMLQGYVKTLRAPSEECSQRYLCEASKEAVRDGRHLGGFVAQVGGFATSYLLENNIPYHKISQATQRGRNSEDCVKLYACQENHL